jgi:hypothetical protein
MKARWPFIIFGSLAVLATLVSVQLLRPAGFRPDEEVAISLLGYTNQSNTFMAVFQVTNRAATTFMCLVGPRASEAGRGGRPTYHDLYPAASPGILKPAATFTFFVPAAPDTNRWRVSVELQGLPVPRRAWVAKVAPVLRLFGIRMLDAKEHHLTSPAFSRPTS